MKCLGVILILINVGFMIAGIQLAFEGEGEGEQFLFLWILIFIFGFNAFWIMQRM